ncbi:N-succinylarginine dihydrolase [Acinetobacter bereziniae]|uniref:N-succinylarginine dihydrolase n=1 Tax=Acinetobacter bereziniae TaxID=106648 RepID=UPI002954F003|nr:N-succinylarginine dihydrolase [Acinetobacter bereziniae]MDV8156604.1 N-succinylarginine dihydrolase [Acinetobacter bereziniae]
MTGYEVNFDGLVGPTHHYAGLSYGNEASTNNHSQDSNPHLAARQGLEKMKALADMGFKQGVFAPQERPHVATLRKIGFSGTDQDVINQAMKVAPQLLSSLSSASSMWAANSCTVSPSADSQDGRVHFTVANLNNNFHRAIEHHTTGKLLAAMFPDDNFFTHHDALPDVALFGDEGAANHNRLGGAYDQQSVQMFVYGRQYINGKSSPQKYPARQTLEACQAISRLHQLDEEHILFAQQHPDVIDQGVFHNDVIAVSNQQVLFHYEQAFLYQDKVLKQLSQKMRNLGERLINIEVPANRISIQDVVQSYLFNSQILTRHDGKMTIVVPEESRKNQVVWSYLNEMIEEGYPIDKIEVFDLVESMQNGGGPACLRLRVAVNQSEFNAINQNVLLNDALYQRLILWVDKHYRDRLSQRDLADPQLLVESHTALDELTQILHLGSVYRFQH